MQKGVLRPSGLRSLECEVWRKGWVRALLRRILLDHGHILPIGPSSSCTSSTLGHAGRTSCPTAEAGGALLPALLMAMNLSTLDVLMGLLSPSLEGLLRAVRDSLPPIGRAAGLSIASLLPPLVGQQDRRSHDEQEEAGKEANSGGRRARYCAEFISTAI